MPVMTEYKPGTFCWVDLSTTDQSAAKKFYSALFGWDANDVPAGPGQTYSLMQKGGKDAAGIGGQMQPGAPPYWSSYVSVNDVAATAAKAKTLGGKVIVEPMDVMEQGKMSVVQDPTGAMVSIWQPGEHFGAAIVNESGTLSWNELLTSDKPTAESFYTGLFGWATEETGDYTIIKNQDKMNGGMMAIRPEWGPMPSNWMVYFSVTDCDAACAKIKDLGGKIVTGPMDIAGTGRFATAQDPQGAYFNVIAMEAPTK